MRNNWCVHREIMSRQNGVQRVWEPLCWYLLQPRGQSHLWQSLYRWMLLPHRYNRETHKYAYNCTHTMCLNTVIFLSYSGTVLDDLKGSGCVPLSQCSCSYNNKIYGPGESYSSNCKKWYDMYVSLFSSQKHSTLWRMGQIKKIYFCFVNMSILWMQI